MVVFRLLLVAFITSGVFACKGDADSPSPAEDAGGDSSMPDPGFGNDIWAPTTVPYDPECKTGCEPLAMGDYGHLGELEISYNPDVDDPIAQWADCLESFQACLFDGRDALECSQQSSCPAACRVDYESRIVGVTDVEAQP